MAQASWTARADALGLQMCSARSHRQFPKAQCKLARSATAMHTQPSVVHSIVARLAPEDAARIPALSADTCTVPHPSSQVCHAHPQGKAPHWIQIGAQTTALPCQYEVLHACIATHTVRSAHCSTHRLGDKQARFKGFYILDVANGSCKAASVSKIRFFFPVSPSAPTMCTTFTGT